MTTYYPGDRVKVFDSRLYKNDKATPLSMTIQPATVIRWYGRKSLVYNGNHESLIDVVFDHDGRESRGHFANEIYVEKIS